MISWRGAILAVCISSLASLHGCVIPISSNAGTDGGTSSSSGTGGEGGIIDSGPIPTGPWINVTGSLVGIPAACASLTAVSAKPDEDLLIAGVSQVGIYGSRDGGQTWQLMGASGDAGSPISNRMSAMVYDPGNSTRFWEVGIYAASPFVTTDDGQTWTELGNISHTDMLAVDFSDPQRKTLLAGGHELAQTLYQSLDSGGTWKNIGAGLPANTNCTLPLIFDSKTYLVGCGGYGGGPTGVYRSTDSGVTWTQMTASGGAVPPLHASDGAIYWVGANNGMTRSLDQGQTWTDVLAYAALTATPSGPPQPVELPGGRIAALGANYVIVSSDQGSTWAPASSALPATPNELLHGLAYSTQRKAFYVWHNTCGFDGPNLVPADAVMRYDYE